MNRFSFCRSNYGASSRWGFDEENITKAEDAMWADVATYLRILARNGRDAIVTVEDGGFVVSVENDYSDSAMGGMMPMWVDENEMDAVLNHRSEVKNGDVDQ
nr:MAG TPA: hypothetical protein [Caudoviricetes sp.]